MPSRALHAAINAALARLAPGALAVGFSGGMDSSVLLHALAAHVHARARGMRAIHIDHGLQRDSAQWAAHCADYCASLGLPLTTLAVTVARDAGRGIEDAARRARMAAFATELRAGETLALAQHRDDQTETVLLKLLRGAGPEGLGAMRTSRPFGAGTLWRPLLEVPRAALFDYAQQHALHWIEDPSNRDTQLRRNFLRAEILPRLRSRWPDADTALAHSATALRATAQFIDAAASAALARLRDAHDPAAIDWRGWLVLPEALRDPVLRHWLRELGLDEPAHLHLRELERQLRSAAHDRQPCIAFARTELRRYRDRLFAMRPMPAVLPGWQAEWDGAEVLMLPDGASLSLRPSRKLSAPLRVSLRQGGERIKPAAAGHTRELRLLLQEAGVPPWRRPFIPLLWRDRELIGVGDLYLSAAGQRICEDHATRVLWTPATMMH